MTAPAILTGRTALVTGAAGGMGRVTAVMLARDGANLALLDRDEAGLKEVVEEIGADRAIGIAADLIRFDELDRAVERTIKGFGGIDILLNIAGYRDLDDKLQKIDADVWMRTYAINVLGPARLIQRVGAAMVERGNGGRIVNVSSSSGFRASGNPPAAYSCAKAALAQLTRVAAADLGPHGIYVNTVVPGPTLTAMAARAGAAEKLAQIAREGPLANLTQEVSMPEDVAAFIRFLCLPECRQVTGQTLHISAGMIV